MFCGFKVIALLKLVQ